VFGAALIEQSGPRRPSRTRPRRARKKQLRIRAGPISIAGNAISGQRNKNGKRRTRRALRMEDRKKSIAAVLRRGVTNVGEGHSPTSVSDEREGKPRMPVRCRQTRHDTRARRCRRRQSDRKVAYYAFLRTELSRDAPGGVESIRRAAESCRRQRVRPSATPTSIRALRRAALRNQPVISSPICWYTNGDQGGRGGHQGQAGPRSFATLPLRAWKEDVLPATEGRTSICARHPGASQRQFLHRKRTPKLNAVVKSFNGLADSPDEDVLKLSAFVVIEGDR